MGIISKIKSFLRVSGDGQDRSPDGRGSGAAVDVEPETGSESAVKGVDEGATGRTRDAGATGRSADSGEAPGSGRSGPEAGDVADATPEPAATEAEAGGDGDAASGTADDAGDSTADDAGDVPAAGREPSGDDGEPVDAIKGIGSAYAERLADAGVETVAELAEADPVELAAATDLGSGRVGKWVDRARARTE